jgi:glycosyltransferase involved in cell wall biosynthesis
MTGGRDVVLISNVDWAPLWQGHQEIATRLARAGNRVFFVENTGVRSPRVSDAARLAVRLARWARAARAGGVRELAPNLYLCSPLVLPPFGSRLRRTINRRMLLRLVRRALLRLDLRDPVVLTYLPTDSAVALCGLLRTPQSVVVYYCVADFAELTPSVADLRESEREIVGTSDLVLANSQELADRFRGQADVHFFPQGVSLDAFPPDTSPASLPPRPVVGYVGGLHRHVDLDLVEQMARRRPEWSWVFVGPLQRPCDQLERVPNIHLIGPRPHHELASYVAGFDACIVPYVVNAYTQTVVPTKVGEYLAMGKPVISTDLPAVRDIASEEDVLTIAEADPEPFANAVAAALARNSNSDVVARRRRAAAPCDWTSRLELLSELIDAVPGGDGGVRSSPHPRAARRAGDARTPA